ncbi:MAG: ATP-binding protein [Kangiellaceae bacterium]|nr:ATP-binding protein [Kangiellaceae bacterium]
MASVGQLAAGVAHEINNPLGYVNSNLNTLKDYVKELGEFIEEIVGQVNHFSSENESGKKVLDIIDRQKEKFDVEFILSDTAELVSESIFGMDKVKKIIQSLKNFTHAGEEKQKKADINACLDETIRIVWNELKYHCEVKKEFSEIPETYCHPSQLNQVFMNLMINAGHAIKEKGVISVSTAKQDNWIIVKIKDNGSGIDEEHLSQLFNPFFTTKPVGQGTGLGLSISYGIIENHKGKIDVESETGVGTCFTISLPIVTEVEEAAVDERELNVED